MPQEGLGNGLFKWKSFPLEVGWKGRPLVFPLWNRLFCLKIPLAKALARGSKDKYSSWHTQGYAGCIYLLRKIQSQIWISTLRILFLTLTHSAGRFVITPTQSTQKLKSRIKKEKLFNSRIKELVSGRVRQVKVTAAKSDGQSLIPQTPHDGRREEVLTSWASDFSTHQSKCN